VKTLSEYKKLVAKSEGRIASIEDQLKEISGQQENLSRMQIAVEEAHAFLQKVAKETQEHLKFHIEDIVNLAVDAVFPDKYEFKVEFEIKRGQTEARIFLLSEDGEEVNPMDDSGGGIVDITAFALRIAAWTLSKTDNVILLDEPARFVSKDLQPKFGEILKTLSKRLNLQFIIVTHNKEIVDVADRIFEVSQIKKVSKIMCREGV
jgi:DNA repair exonuclease SbcCD ATPase subunit